MKYLDTAATTKVDDRVLEVMTPYFTEIFGNASSSHAFGKKANHAIEKARSSVAALINADSDEIIFTSGSTESINLALKGYVEANYEKGNHIITLRTEHKAVLSTCEYLETKGVEVTYLNVDKYGQISLEELKNAIRVDTLLVCVMLVNNETGIIQPIEKIGEIVKNSNAKFFCDATQGIGKFEIDVEKNHIDMLCFSGHKINAPKGIGVLYKKDRIELTPLIHGGGQEKGLRGGTYNTALIAGLGKAVEIIEDEHIDTERKLRLLNDFAIQELKKINGLKILGKKNLRTNNIINVYIPKINADIFLSKITTVALSNGSACTSEIIEESHVLKAMGITASQSQHHLRLSFDKFTTMEDIAETVKILNLEISQH